MIKRNKGLVNFLETYNVYFDMLLQIVLSRFTWKKLPETINERFLEYTLINRGCIAYFNDDVIGDLTLPTTLGGMLNIYNEPIKRHIYAVNGYQTERDNTNSVIIYNNLLKTPDINRIVFYATKLANIDCTTQINVHAQKTPILIDASEDTVLTLKNAYLKYDGFTPVILSNKKINVGESFNVLSTNAPYLADKLSTLFSTTWNEALTALGVPNISVSKKERLLTDEVNRMQGGTIANRLSALKARQQAVEQINAMFGRDISVDFNDYSSTEGEVSNVYNDSQAVM